MKLVILFVLSLSIFSCKGDKSALPMETGLFKYTEELSSYMKPIEKVSPLVSLEKEQVLVTTSDFSITNKYVIPFLHYQLMLNQATMDTITTDKIEDFMYMYAYIFAKNELIAREAELTGLKVSDEEVETLIEESSQGRIEEFKEFINQTSLTFDYYLKDIRQSMLINKYEKEILNGITVTDEEKKNYYESNPTIALQNPKIQAKNIVIKYKQGKNKDKEKALKLITDIRNKVVNGSDFSELAKKYSDDAISAAEGGKMADYITRGSLEPNAELIVFSTKTGEISSIIEQPDSFEIIKVDAIENEGKVEYADIEETIGKILKYEKEEQIIKADTERITKKYNLKTIRS